jgi:Zn-dependent M28 family amino/carboxypeptidase
VSALAHDSMQGRLTGSVYEEQAAFYVRDKFLESGLDPAVQGFIQEFDVPGTVRGQSGQESQNVLAVLPGAGDLALEWVIIGAHYDHVGVDGVGTVYNGADDNASGTALLLETARVLSEYIDAGGSGTRGRRSVMFQAYGAEEVGLIGSNHFCSQPTVPMGDITAMINFDMVGRLRNNTLILIGTSSSAAWPTVLGPANRDALDFVFSDDVLNRSDQYCFYVSGVPVVFMHTGTHAEYHTVADDTGLIDELGMARVGDFAVRVVLDLIHRETSLSPQR